MKNFWGSSKLQFGQRKTPVCKAPIKMLQPCNRKNLFVQFEKCMYAIPKPPFSASRNLTFCYRYSRFADIMLHPDPPTPRNGGCRSINRIYSMSYIQLPIPTPRTGEHHFVNVNVIVFVEKLLLFSSTDTLI